MGDLATYSLSDFILFSASAYYRQFEFYNQAIWPLQLLAIVFAALLFYALTKRPVWAGRSIAAVLVISWLWVAYAFLYQRFYQIHVVANWYAIGFVVQAGLVTWSGMIRDRFADLTASPLRFMFGWVMLLAGLIVYPFIAIVTGRNWLQFEMFGLAPDPTALATLGLLLIFKTPGFLYVIPLLWLVVSYTTQYVM